MVLNTINRMAQTVEVGCNIGSNLPTRLGKEISVIRGVGGVAQVAFGVLANGVGLCEVVTGLLFSNRLFLHGLRVLTFGCEHIVHGALNSATGFTEFALHFTPYQIGSVVFLIVRARSKFQPTLPYKTNYGVEVPQDPRGGAQPPQLPPVQDALPLPPQLPRAPQPPQHPQMPQGIAAGGIYFVPIQPMQYAPEAAPAP